MPSSKAKRQVECDVCHKQFDIGKVRPVEMVHGPLLDLIKQDNPEAMFHGYVCLDDLADYRLRLVHDILAGEQAELTTAAKVVLDSFESEEDLLSRDAYGDYDKQSTSGERIADRVATFGGSWAFIISFGAVLFVWIAVNTIGLLQRPFDPSRISCSTSS